MDIHATKAAKDYGLNFQTLQKYVTKQMAYPNQDIAMTPQYKSRLIINEEEESSLVDIGQYYSLFKNVLRQVY